MKMQCVYPILWKISIIPRRHLTALTLEYVCHVGKYRASASKRLKRFTRKQRAELIFEVYVFKVVCYIEI